MAKSKSRSVWRCFILILNTFHIWWFGRCVCGACDNVACYLVDNPNLYFGREDYLIILRHHHIINIFLIMWFLFLSYIYIYRQNLCTVLYVLFFKFISYDSTMCLLNLKNTFPLMRKKSYGRIFKEEPKEQLLSTVFKFCLYIYIYILLIVW